MIQIRKIREYTPRGEKESKKFDAAFSPNLQASSAAELFTKLPDYINQIPEKERYNVYFTLGHMPETSDGQHRKWARQEVIPFDIDDIEYIDDKPRPEYIPAITSALGVDPEKCVIIATGNGLQILVQPEQEIKSSTFFKEHSIHYLAVLSRISQVLRDKSLLGEPDPTAFEENRLFRLPDTLNIKPNRPKRVAKILKGNLQKISFDLKTLSGIPDIAPKDAISEKALAFFALDTIAIESGCEFLKYTKENPAKISEPQWYAALSIVARLREGSKKAHLYSKGHPNYSERETNQKIEQALKSSGPRTCENINSLWGNCKNCPNFKKVNSPVSIRGPGFIATKDTGFHLFAGKNNFVPQYEDLRLFYSEKHTYVNSAKSHYRWTGTHYEFVDDMFLDNFAQTHFAPACNNNKANEFRALVKRTNLVTPEFFQPHRLVNFENGVLNLDTNEIVPHSSSVGFLFTLPYKYDQLATAPVFTQFLEDVTCGDKTLQAVLLEYMGYCISGDAPLAHKLLVLTGEGANGKSTFVNILKALIGKAYSAVNAANLSSEFHRVLLHNSLLNVSEELPKFTDAATWELIKDMASGGDITASRKFKDQFTFPCHTKLIMLTNNIPKGADVSQGLLRRFIICPFKASFEGGRVIRGLDRQIAEKELPGVFNMALEGYHRLKANNYNFTDSVAVNQAVEKYELEIDSVAAWASEHVSFGDAKPGVEWIKKLDNNEYAACVTEMRASYYQWCESQGDKAVGIPVFTKRLLRYAKTRTGLELGVRVAKIGKKATKVIDGVRFKEISEF